MTATLRGTSTAWLPVRDRFVPRGLCSRQHRVVFGGSHDGTEDGPTVTSDALVVGNATPVVTDIPLAPSDPRTDDTISVGEVVSTDADGDPVVSHRYAWLVDGEGRGDGGTLTSVHFGRGDSVSVRVWASDEFGEGEPVESDPVEILTPRRAPPVELRPRRGRHLGVHRR